MVSVISTLMFDVSYAVEVLVFMFAGGVRFHTYVVFLIQSVVSCSCLYHIYSLFLPMSWVLGLSILLSIYCVYIYVRLIMSSYLFFWYLLFNVWYITCCPNGKKLWNLHVG